MKLHQDFHDLLAEFARGGVRFALIGGYAVGFHARPRATKDMDLLVSRRGDNLDRVASALQRFGAAPRIVEAARKLAPTEVVYLGVAPVRIDLLSVADGIDTEEAIASAVTAEVGGVPISVISIEHLIANKRAAGRPQDLADVAALERARARMQNGP